MPSESTPKQHRLSSHDFGRWGESVAADRYSSAGFQILERNWRCRDGEIDLIAAQLSVVVFVEVKARSSNRYGSATEAVDWRKQQKIRSVAVQWLGASPQSFQEIRFDVATVDSAGVVTVYESCF